jgi:hypothetical protein
VQFSAHVTRIRFRGLGERRGRRADSASSARGASIAEHGGLGPPVAPSREEARSARDRWIRLSFGLGVTMVRGPMFLMLSKHPRKLNRTKTKRFRAKLAAKNRARRNRIYVRAK